MSDKLNERPGQDLSPAEIERPTVKMDGARMLEEAQRGGPAAKLARVTVVSLDENGWPVRHEYQGVTAAARSRLEQVSETAPAWIEYVYEAENDG